MHQYHFDRFVFDPRLLQLRTANRHIDLRPKTARMLKVLLDARGEVVGKRELIRAVWQTDHVTDQSLFQAVSELRRKLAPLEAIQTHPNIGYQWVAAVHQGAPRRWRAVAALAAMASSAALVVLAHGFFAIPNGQTALAAPQLPALQALASGMTSLRANRLTEAEQQFSLAVTENPRFREARLLLAETWLAQGDAGRARDAANALLEEQAGAHGSYVSMAAMDLLSRSSQRSGMFNAALDWAVSAADSARSQGFVCAAADLQDRIADLIGRDEFKAVETPPQQSPLLAAESSERPAYCSQIQRELPEIGQFMGAPVAPEQVCARFQNNYRSMV